MSKEFNPLMLYQDLILNSHWYVLTTNIFESASTGLEENPKLNILFHKNKSHCRSLCISSAWLWTDHFKILILFLYRLTPHFPSIFGFYICKKGCCLIWILKMLHNKYNGVISQSKLLHRGALMLMHMIFMPNAILSNWVIQMAW